MRKVAMLAAVSAAVLAGVQSSNAAVLLRETYQIPAADTSGGGYNNQAATFTGWHGFGDDGGSTFSQYPANPAFYEAQLGPWGQGVPNNSTGQTYTATSPTHSTPSTLDASSPTLPGTVYFSGIATDIFGFTTKAAVAGAGINSSSLTSVSFQVNTFDAADSLTAALQIGGNWYYSLVPVSDGTTLGFGNTSWQTDTFSTTGNTWALLNVTLGTNAGGSSAAPASGTPLSLPAGTITGLGWYQATKGDGGAGGATGYDIGDYVLNGTASVPEPATLSVLGLGTMGLLARRRKA